MKRVYFLRPVGQLGPIKIGCSKLPELRLETLTTWSPMRLEMVCSVPGSHKDERTLHGMFRKHQVHGEWFGASKELLALIDHCSFHRELPELPEVIAFPRTRHVGHRGRAAGKKESGELSPDKLEIARTMRGQYESGMTAAVIAAEHGVTTPTAYKFIRAAGGIIRQRGVRKSEHGVLDIERAEEFKRRYLAGETFKQIGDSHNLSRQRVRQILRKTNVESLGHRPEHIQQPHELTETELLAAELYKNGTRPSIIKERTGLTNSQVIAAVVRMGVEKRPKGFWLTLPEDAEITARVCDLYQKGFSAPQIVQRVPQLKFPETVYRYLKKGGVPVRNPHMGNFRHERLNQRRSA
jgi:hypothetical protein